MPQGLEVKNTYGSFQITQETRVISYLRKGIAVIKPKSTNQWVEASCFAEIPCDPLTEICAVRCTELISYLYNENGKLYVGMASNQSGSYPDVEYWIFGKANTVSSSGIQVFDGNGTKVENLLYDSSWNPIKPIKIIKAPKLVNSASYTENLPSNRKHAYIPMVVHSETSRNVRELNQTGTVDQEWEISYDRIDDAAKITGNTFTISRSAVSHYFYFVMGQTYWNDSNFYTDNNAKTQYMIVDVTGL